MDLVRLRTISEKLNALVPAQDDAGSGPGPEDTGLSDFDRLRAAIDGLGDGFSLEDAAAVIADTAAGATPVLTIAEFFDGNTDEHSMIANAPHPPLWKMRAILEEIAQLDGIDSVRIAIAEHFSVEDQLASGTWPYTDTFLVISRRSPDDIEAVFAALAPSDIWIGTENRYAGLPPIPAGSQLFNIWWD